MTGTFVIKGKLVMVSLDPGTRLLWVPGLFSLCPNRLFISIVRCLRIIENAVNPELNL